MTEDDAKKVLQGHGLCGFISNGDQISDGDDCSRQACILPRHHDTGMHEPPAMLTVTRLLIERANAALESFISGALSELSEGRTFRAYEQEAWDKAIFARDALLAQIQK